MIRQAIWTLFSPIFLLDGLTFRCLFSTAHSDVDDGILQILLGFFVANRILYLTGIFRCRMPHIGSRSGNFFTILLTSIANLISAQDLHTTRKNLWLFFAAPNEGFVNLEHGEFGPPLSHLNAALPDRSTLRVLHDQAMGLHFVIEARLIGWHTLDTMGKEVALDLSGYQRRHQPQRLGGDKPLSAFFIQADLFCDDMADGALELALYRFPGHLVDIR